MERIVVSSSNIQWIEHESEDGEDTLRVCFRGGGIYKYNQVPKEVFDDMKIAKSVGSFFHTNIKDAYPFEKV